MEAVFAAIQEAVAGVAARVGPAVAGLGRGWARGSGIVVAEGRGLTAAHVLRGEEVAVTFADGRTAGGRVTGADADLDVGVVAVDTGDIVPVEWDPAAPGRLAGGAAVLALAHPGGHGLRTTLGLVSATGHSFRGPRGRRIPGSIEHTAPLPRGSSGGPLVDADGRLLGLNAVRMDGGLIIALPADAAPRERADGLARGETPARPRLGVAIAPAHVARRLRRAVGLPEREGLLVRWVEEGGPAARGGIEKGDLIVAAAGEPVARVDDLLPRVEAAAGGELALTLVRGTEEREVTVSLTTEEAVA